MHRLTGPLVFLEERHAEPGLRQLLGGVQSGRTAADNDGIN
jgi:hypothetical protein